MFFPRRATDVPNDRRLRGRRALATRARVAQLLAALCLSVEAGCTTAVRGPAAAGVAGTVIVNARVLDGSGAPARPVAVRVVGDRIVEVGPIRPRPGDRV